MKNLILVLMLVASGILMTTAEDPMVRYLAFPVVIILSLAVSKKIVDYLMDKTIIE